MQSERRLPMLAAALFLAVALFPVLFMGRVVSPADVLTNHDPWARIFAPVVVQNPLLDDAGTGWLPLLIAAKRLPEGLFWDPSLASGVPGAIQLTSFLLSPLVFLPTLLLPVRWIFTAMVVLRFLVGFGGMFVLLRREGFDRQPATLGAMLWGGCGGIVVWWLWPQASVCVVFPLLVVTVRRAFEAGSPVRRFLPFAAVTFLCCSGGYPPWAIQGAVVAVAAIIEMVLRQRRQRLVSLAGLALAGVLGLLPLLPSIVTFSEFLQRSGHLERRADLAAETGPVPLAHLQLLLDPWAYGRPHDGSDRGVPGLRGINNFVETSIEMGRLALPLIVLGLVASVAGRRRPRPVWPALFLVVAVAMYTPFGGPLLSRLPGLGNSPVIRLKLLLFLAAAALATSGFSRLLEALPAARRQPAGTVLVLAVTFELGLFAARFLPFLPPELAEPRTTPVLERLKEETARQPSRFAATFTALWPNSAQQVGLEDVRSHFLSEADYRRLLTAVDPKVFGEHGTFLLFDGLRMRAGSPVLDLLGVRWLLEPPEIRLVSPLARDSYQVHPASGGWLTEDLGRNGPVRQPFRVPDRLARIGLWVWPQPGSSGHLDLFLEEEWSGRTVWTGSRQISGDGRTPLWVDVGDLPATFSRSRLRLVVEGSGVDGVVGLPAATPDPDWPTAQVGTRSADTSLAALLDREGIVERPDIGGWELRVFERRHALPRWWAVWQVQVGGVEEIVALGDRFDPARQALVDVGQLDSVRRFLGGGGARRGVFRILDDRPERQLVDIQLDAPALVVSSMKFHAPHHARLDGKPIAAIPTNGLFRGYEIPAGRHRLELTAGPFARWGDTSYRDPEATP